MPNVRAKLKTAGLPVEFWDLAAMSTVHELNRMYRGGAYDCVPISGIINNSKPDVSFFRTFGCPAYVHIPRHRRLKMEDTAFKGIFVGYSLDTRGYVVWNPATRRLVTTKHVRFDETFGGRFAEEGNHNQEGISSSPSIPRQVTFPSSHPIVDSESDDDDLQPIYEQPAALAAVPAPFVAPVVAPAPAAAPVPNNSGSTSGVAPRFQPLMSTPMPTAPAKRRTAEGSESTPSAPEPAPPTAGPSDGNSVAARQDDQSEGAIFGDANSTQDSGCSLTASTPSTVSTSLVNTDKL